MKTFAYSYHEPLGQMWGCRNTSVIVRAETEEEAWVLIGKHFWDVYEDRIEPPSTMSAGMEGNPLMEIDLNQSITELKLEMHWQ